MNDNNVAVFGIGRVGLPLALLLTDRGYNVTGIDPDHYKLELIRHKIMPFLEEGAAELLQKYFNNGFKVFSNDQLSYVVSDNRTIIMTLGTPIDETYSPNFTQIEGLISNISPFIKSGHLIILRSTISPGTTEQLARQLEEQTKLKIGKDLFLAYCPERIAEGKSIQELTEIPQIIGGLEEESKKQAAQFFSKITSKILFTNTRSAELAKLFCNMYRYIDFAIGNEFMMIAEDHGCDIYEVLHLVNHEYKRSGLKSPGFTAGPCLVKDGFFLIDKSPYMELVTAAWRMNENIPGYILSRIKRHIPNLHKKKVGMLGLSFKKNIDDLRYSLAPKMKRHLLAEGAIVRAYDPLIESDLLEETLKDAEILIVTINHDQFNDLEPEFIKKLVSKDCLICDIWNIFGVGKIVFPVMELKRPNGQATSSSQKKINQFEEKEYSLET